MPQSLRANSERVAVEIDSLTGRILSRLYPQTKPSSSRLKRRRFLRTTSTSSSGTYFYSNRGRVWLIKGESERALDDLNRAIALAEAWSYRGVAWLAKENFTRAITDFNQALKLNPRLTDAYCSRGVTRLAQGKLEKAEADVARCRARILINLRITCSRPDRTRIEPMLLIKMD